MKKFFYIYKITLIKGSFAGYYYFGQHRTNNLNDGYAGSGRILLNYYEKYGKIEGVTYVKEIIKFFDTLEELNQGEIDLIGDKYKTDEYCLNLRAGGNQNGFSDEVRERISKNHKGGRPKGFTFNQNKDAKLKIGKAKKNIKQSCEHIQKRIQSKIDSGNSKHSEETKQKISNSKKGKHRMYIDENHYIMVA